VAGQVAGATDFTDSEWQAEVDDRRLITSITHGRGGMPAFEKKLTPEQVKSMVTYIRAFKKVSAAR
jgi:mono/diheme cytochrome c family protein